MASFAALAFVPAAGAAKSSTPDCHATLAVLAREYGLVLAGQSIDKVICHDFTGDGRTDIAFTVFSGGTAGDTQWGVFVAEPGGRWRLAAHHSPTYGTQLRRSGDDLLVARPYYGPGAANCCPTYFIVDHWRYFRGRARRDGYQHGTFVKLRSRIRHHHPF